MLLLSLVSLAVLSTGVLANPVDDASTSVEDDSAFYETLNEIKQENIASGNARSSCPAGFIPWGTTCHLFFPRNFKVDWFEAQIACKAAGGRLISIEKDDENNYLKTNFNRLYSSEVWIGAHALGADYRWLNTNQPLKYSDWDRKEPNNDGGDEFCVEADDGESFKWNDEDCVDKNNCACEYP